MGLQRFIRTSCGISMGVMSGIGVDSVSLRRAWVQLCILGSALVVGIGASAVSSSAHAQFSSDMPSLQEAERVNERAIGIIFNFAEDHRRLVNDVAQVISDGESFRLIPVLGQNHVQNVLDLLYLKGIDLAVIQSDVLAYMEKAQLYDGLENRVRSLTKLYDEKIVIIAGDKFQTLQDLTFQSVNFGELGSGSDITGTIVFDALGIEVQRTRYTTQDALKKIKSGELAAMVYLVEDSANEMSREGGVHLIGLPQNEFLSEQYSLTQLTHDDFPNLLEKFEKISTLASAVVIASYNWEPADKWRYLKLKSFVDAFVNKFDNLKKSGTHPHWNAITLADAIPGIERLDLAEIAMSEIEANKAIERVTALREDVSRVQEQLEIQLNEKMAQATDPEEIERLISELKKLIKVPN